MGKDETIDKAVLDLTLVGIASLRNIGKLSHLVKNLKGDVGEVGVYRGGVCIITM